VVSVLGVQGEEVISYINSEQTSVVVGRGKTQEQFKVQKRWSSRTSLTPQDNIPKNKPYKKVRKGRKTQYYTSHHAFYNNRREEATKGKRRPAAHWHAPAAENLVLMPLLALEVAAAAPPLVPVEAPLAVVAVALGE
jgi:hypothetical protein